VCGIVLVAWWCMRGTFEGVGTFALAVGGEGEHGGHRLR